MTTAELSIKRPIFITCVIFLSLVMGFLSLKKLPVDLFPDITFPVVTVTTAYPGAGPEEIETLVSKVYEDEISTLPGIKRLRSINREGVSTVIAEFTLETDVKYAEQVIRDRTGAAKRKLPADAKEPIIRRIDPSDQPVLIISLQADLPEADLYDLANEDLRPKIEQVNKVGLVEVIGARKREIQIELDRARLKSYEISSNAVANRIAAAGQNIPAGKVDIDKSELIFRTLGEFKSLKDIEGTIVNFLGNDVPVTVTQIGEVKDGLVDEKTRSFVNGKKSLLLTVYRQSGANTIAVVDAVKKRVEELNGNLKTAKGSPSLSIVRDGAWPVRANVEDVEESILIGIGLTIVVVFFFLGSFRSTLITGLALPNSLLGAFFLMAIAGFTINIMSLLALSLSVGLLIDDAIVVRENIFRHLEMGKSPKQAALDGTHEVTLAVIATTLTVIAVFGPIGFLQGVVGQFFKQFGLTICFAMAISLFDALTIAPMLSAYFAGALDHGAHGANATKSRGPIRRLLDMFDRFQTRLEDGYERAIDFSIRKPKSVLFLAVAVFVLSLAATSKVPKTFLPAQDQGEFSVTLELPPGTNLDAMNALATEVDGVLRKNPEIALTVMTVGNRDGAPNVADFYVKLIPTKQRKVNTTQMKERLREQLKPFASASPVVKDYDAVGAGQRPFNVNILGSDLAQVEKSAFALYEKLKAHPGLKDLELSHKPGKPEFQVQIDNRRAEAMGISTLAVGLELRTLTEGTTPAVFRERGREYDIRVRLKPEQRNLKDGFEATWVPNINNNLIRLKDVSAGVETTGPAVINRQDRGRFIQISGDIAPNGPGMGGVMADVRKMLAKDGELALPEGLSYAFVGQAENFQELAINMIVAVVLGIIFIYLVLASLYESFITPLTIMLVLPLAACGAFYALFITQQSLDIFSMIGCVMLLGIATKNSILLVDYTNHLMGEGLSRDDALRKAGRTRLRPILMTTIALIMGMLPIAIGLNEASRQRTSMGIAIIGGLITSTLLTLVVVPAAYAYIDRFRLWSGGLMRRIFVAKNPDGQDHSP